MTDFTRRVKIISSLGEGIEVGVEGAEVDRGRPKIGTEGLSRTHPGVLW